MAAALVDGASFGASANDYDWLGHGIYFWEYGPQQAWWWAGRRYGQAEAAVIGAMIRLGRCLDLLDPANIGLLRTAQAEFRETMHKAGVEMPRNRNENKYLDCAVFNFLFDRLERKGYNIDSSRAVFVPMVGGKLPRLWERSGVFEGGHIQVCVRCSANILAVWPVRKDGRYGKD